jgi:D-alanyl-D-alanine carboxypeptidase
MATASTLDDRLEAVVRSGLPGVVAVASGPGRHEEGAAGLANVATDEPLTVEHRFRVASVTKVFIATAVLQLAGEGAIELDGDAGPLVPGVTVRQLLNHTSGVPNAADDFGAFLEPYRLDPAHKSELGPSEMLALALERPRLFAPGEGWAYTGSNYQALGLLVERATETPLREALKRRIFDPLGLSATDLPEQTWPVAGLARAYFPADNPLLPGPGPGPVDATELDLPFNWTGGGIVSSGRDLARFLQALLGGELLPEALRAEMLRTVPSDWDESDGYGLGLCEVSSLMGKADSPCGPAWGHLGLGGHLTIALASERGERQAVVLMNGYALTDESWQALGALVWGCYCG